MSRRADVGEQEVVAIFSRESAADDLVTFMNDRDGRAYESWSEALLVDDEGIVAVIKSGYEERV